jgi:hypothetical protein
MFAGIVGWVLGGCGVSGACDVGQHVRLAGRVVFRADALFIGAGWRVRHRVLKTLGREDELKASGQLEQLMGVLRAAGSADGGGAS